MAGPGNILIKVGAEAGQAISELSSVEKSLGSTMTASEKMGAGIKKAAVPAGLALVALGAGALDAAKAAAVDAAAADKLAGVLERTTGATAAQAKAIDDWVEKLARDGRHRRRAPTRARQASRARPATSRSPRRTCKSRWIAAATGKDVVTVSAAIAKGYTGQTAGLNKLVRASTRRRSNQRTWSLSRPSSPTRRRRRGAPRPRRPRVNINVHESGCKSRGVARRRAAPGHPGHLAALHQLATFASENTKVIEILRRRRRRARRGHPHRERGDEGLRRRSDHREGRDRRLTAAQWSQRGARREPHRPRHPSAVAALAAGLVIAYTKSATFRQIVGAAFDAVKVAVDAVAGAMSSLLNAASSAFNWIVSHWKLGLFAFGPIGAAVLVIVDNFHTLGVASSVFDAIAAAIGGITGAIHSVIDAVESLISALGRIHVPSIHIRTRLASRRRRPRRPAGAARRRARARARAASPSTSTAPSTPKVPRARFAASSAT